MLPTLLSFWQTCFHQHGQFVLANVMVPEAPRSWLLDCHKGLVEQIWSFGWFSAMVIAILFFLYSGGKYSVFATSMVVASSYGLSRILDLSSMDDSKLERSVLVGLCLCFILFQFTTLAAEGIVERDRSYAWCTSFWMALPIVLGLRLKVYMGWATFSFIVECVVDGALRHKYNKYLSIEHYTILILAHIFHFALARQRHVCLKRQYEREQQLLTENEAMESKLCQAEAQINVTEASLSMMTDAIIWLSSDADTVAKSSHCLDGALGFSMQDERLSQFVAESEYHRLLQAIRNSSSDAQRLSSSLISGSREEGLEVDLFIVGSPLESAGVVSGLQYMLAIQFKNRLASGREDLEPQNAVLATCQLGMGSSEIISDAAADVMGGANRNLPRIYAQSHLSFSDAASDPSTPLPATRKASRASLNSIPFAAQRLPSHFPESSDYLRHLISDFLVEVMLCMNFRVTKCCAWHSAHAYLSTFLSDLSDHYKCADDWKPASIRQCQRCTALAVDDRLDCWICGIPHVDASTECESTQKESFKSQGPSS